MKNNYFLILLILLSQIVFSQSKENKKIYGKITAGQVPVDDIEVVNFSNATQTRTNAKGEFYI